MARITLDADGRAALAAATRDNVGAALVVLVDGEEVGRPIIREPILGGSLELDLSGDHAAMRAVIAKLRAASADPGLIRVDP